MNTIERGRRKIAREDREQSEREFWIVLYDGSVWDSEEWAVKWAQGPRESAIHHVKTIGIL